MHKASVIIPTHNRPHFLRDALRSVVDQQDVELDVIVIGDGSGADTEAVAAEFPTVRYVAQPQSGPMAARNRAVKLARFDCIALLDDDDLWMPGKMRAQMDVLDSQPDAAYVFSDFHILRAGHPLQPQGLSTWGIPADDWVALQRDPVGAEPRAYRVHLYDALLEHPYVLPTTAIFRRSFLTPDIRFVDHDYICGDWEFFARLSRNHPAIYMPVETACNRSHEEAGRLTRTPDTVQLQRRLEMIERTWAADGEFMASAANRRRVRDIRLRYLAALAKHQLRESQDDALRETLRHAQTMEADSGLGLRALGVLANVPGGLAALRGLDRGLRYSRGLLKR